MTVRACAGNLGMSLGGVIVGSLGMLLGYFGVYFCLSVITVFTSLIIFIFKDVRDTNEIIDREQSQLTFTKFLSVRRSILNLVCGAMCDFPYNALEPTLAIKLK